MNLLTRWRSVGITLALGGGGVKGYAHLGVLTVLEEAGIPIRAVAGTSIGAWVGGLYAAGKPPGEILEWFRSLPPDLIRHRRAQDLPAHWGLGGFEQAFRDFLHPLERIEETPKPFGAAAVDLNTGRTVYLTRGPLVPALLASAALPGVFPPVPWGEHILVDGGVLDNIPVRLARWLAPRAPVVAVVLTTPPEELARRPLPNIGDRIPVLGGLFKRSRYMQALAYFLRAADMSGAALTYLRLKIDRPEVVIRVPLAHVTVLGRDADPEDIYRRGLQAAQQALPHIQRVLKRFFPRPTPRLDMSDVDFLEPP